MKKTLLIQLLTIAICLGLTASVTAAKPPTTPKKPATTAKKGTAAPKKKASAPPADIPTTNSKGLPNVLSESAVVIDLKTGQELFAKNASMKRPIASLTKLAAALAVRKKKIDLDGITEVTERDAEIARRGAPPHIKVGWKIKNKDLLFAALIASENRAVPAMGRGAGLSEGEMIKAMNQVSKDLGLKSTFFDEVTGLSYENKSTAREVAVLLKTAMKDEVLQEAMTQEELTLYAVEPAGVSTVMSNTNRILRDGTYKVLGAKTGYNDMAGYCFAIAVSVDGHDLLIVTLGASGKFTRYGDVSRIVTWVQNKDKLAASNPTSTSK